MGVLGWLLWHHRHDRMGPFLSWNADPRESISIRWISPSPCSHKIILRKMPQGEPLPQVQSSPVTRHVADFHGLAPNTAYCYEIWESDIRIFAGKTFCFQTAPRTPTSFSFVAVGDIQAADPVSIIQARVLWQARRSHPAFLLTMGDNVHNWEDDASWRVFFSLIGRLGRSAPIFTTPGNHDKGVPSGERMAQQYLLVPDKAWNYSFIFSNALIISLLSWDEEKITPQIIWFEEVLRHKPPHVDWVIVFWHVPWWGPPYNKNHPNDLWETKLREMWGPVFEHHHVDLVLAGHKHGYARFGNKIITAAMHGVRDYAEKHSPDEIVINKHHHLRVNVADKQLVVTAVSWTGQTIDMLKLEK